ncbi:MAG: anti-sigma factor antagonist [Nostocales cyanobacterium]|nr:MAG: anti-sigma factor antagonist [Nostocales cyanobacterium]
MDFQETKETDLEITLEISGDIAKITLVGELDASTAENFKHQVEEAAKLNPQQLVLMMQKLDFMASAGLRVLIFAKQKMGANVKIYMVGVQDPVLETITKTGFHKSVYLLDKYDA